MSYAQRTAEQLIQAVREEANQELPSGADPTKAFATDTEILRRLVEAQYELYDLMLDADEYYNATSFTYQVAAGALLDVSTLPTPGFYRMLGLDLYTGGLTPVPVNRLTFAERNRWVGLNPAATYTIWYTPRLTELVTGGGKLDLFADNYQKYLILAAAAVIMSKAEESDPSSVLAAKGVEQARILGSFSKRSGGPGQIPDVTDDYYRGDIFCQDRVYSMVGTQLIIRGGGSGGSNVAAPPVISGASFVFSVQSVSDLAAYPDALLTTSQAQAHVRDTDRNYWLETNTGNPDDSTGAANYVNAPSGRQWVGQ